MVGATGIEPVTSPVWRERTTAVLRAQPDRVIGIHVKLVNTKHGSVCTWAYHLLEERPHLRVIQLTGRIGESTYMGADFGFEIIKKAIAG